MSAVVADSLILRPAFSLSSFLAPVPVLLTRAGPDPDTSKSHELRTEISHEIGSNAASNAGVKTPIGFLADVLYRVNRTAPTCTFDAD